MRGALNDDELQRLYAWVDEISLSRPKRNIARDFSDGVLLAEVSSRATIGRNRWLFVEDTLVSPHLAHSPPTAP